MGEVGSGYIHSEITKESGYEVRRIKFFNQGGDATDLEVELINRIGDKVIYILENSDGEITHLYNLKFGLFKLCENPVDVKV